MSNVNGKIENENISPERISELSRAFQGSRVFLTAYELDLFSAVGDDKKTSQAIAGIIDADPRGTDRLLNALCAMGLIIKSGDKYANSAVAGRFLVKGKPEYQTGIMHTVHLWDSWSTLTNAVRDGGLVIQRSVEERDDVWFKSFIAAMHSRAVGEASGLVSKIDLSGVYRVLDVGGGSGAYSIAFVRAKEDVQATVFDLPNVLPLTEGYIKEAGLENRINTVSGDYNKDDLGNGYDLVFLSAIIHSNSPQQNQSLFHKVSKAMETGGRIIVSDFIMNDNRFEPTFGAFFALNMLVNTQQGDTYTESEIREWMTAAKLEFVERKDFGINGLMIGRKI